MGKGRHAQVRKLERTPVVYCILTPTTCRFSRIVHIDIDSITDASSPAFTRDFRAVVPETEVSTHDLISHGHVATSLGTANNILDVSFYLSNNIKVTAPPDFNIKKWMKLDSTFPNAYSLAISNPTKFTRWTTNSCSADVNINALIASGAVVRQGDQISFARWRTLDPCGAALRMVLSTNWHKLPWQPTRQALVRIIKTELTKLSSIHFNDGNLADANEVAFGLTSSSPLPSHLTIQSDSYVCCDGERFLGGGKRAARSMSVWGVSTRDADGKDILPGETIAQIIRAAHFDSGLAGGSIMRDPNRREDGSMAAMFPPCSNGERCTGLVTKERLHYVRLAPVLDVRLQNGDRLMNTARQWFQPLSIPHLALNQVQHGPMAVGEQDPQALVSQDSGSYRGDPEQTKTLEERLVQNDYEVSAVIDRMGAHFTLRAPLPGRTGAGGIYKQDAFNRAYEGGVWVAKDWMDAWPENERGNVELMAIQYTIRDRAMLEKME